MGSLMIQPAVVSFPSSVSNTFRFVYAVDRLRDLSKETESLALSRGMHKLCLKLEGHRMV